MSTQASLALAPILAAVNGVATTLSTDVAAFFHKLHKNVVQAIENLLPDLPGGAELNFQPSEYTDPTGRILPAYRLTRTGFILLAMGFTGRKALAFKLAYIDAFDAMEAQLRATTPAPAPGPSIDVKALLTEGQFDPCMEFPPEVQEAIDARTWDLTREAYGYIRTHLQRCAAGGQGVFNDNFHTNSTLYEINQRTLSHALTLAHQEALDSVKINLQICRTAATKALKSLETQT